MEYYKVKQKKLLRPVTFTKITPKQIPQNEMLNMNSYDFFHPCNCNIPSCTEMSFKDFGMINNAFQKERIFKYGVVTSAEKIQ